MNLHNLTTIDSPEELLAFVRWRFPSRWIWRIAPTHRGVIEYNPNPLASPDRWDAISTWAIRTDYREELQRWRQAGSPTTR